MNEPTTTTVLVGLPVAVTHDPATGRWSVEVDLSELAESIDEFNDGVDVSALVDQWVRAAHGHDAFARTEVRFTAREAL